MTPEKSFASAMKKSTRKRGNLKSREFAALTLLIVFLGLLTSSVTLGIFFSKYTTRFCYNSPNITVTSQCVYCNYFSFDATVLGCTGSSAVTINMTSTQAFCVIAQCLGQVRQTPVFLGRKKRALDDGLILEKDSNANETSSSESTESNEEKVEIDIGNETMTEPSFPQTTTQIVEFTYNGQQERYIVAQEVTVEVYIPDPLFDSDSDYALNDVSNEPDSRNDSISNRDKYH